MFQLFKSSQVFVFSFRVIKIITGNVCSFTTACSDKKNVGPCLRVPSSCQVVLLSNTSNFYSVEKINIHSKLSSPGSLVGQLSSWLREWIGRGIAMFLRVAGAESMNLCRWSVREVDCCFCKFLTVFFGTYPASCIAVLGGFKTD